MSLSGSRISAVENLTITSQISDDKLPHLHKVILRNEQHDQREQPLDPHHPRACPRETRHGAAEQTDQYQQRTHPKGEHEKIDKSQDPALRRADPRKDGSHNRRRARRSNESRDGAHDEHSVKTPSFAS